MKIIKTIILICFTIFLLSSTSPLRFIFPTVVFGILCFNFLNRKLLSYKGYFTSPFNILIEKKVNQIEYDIPVNLMFEKIKELIEDSPFEVADIDEASKQILAISTGSMSSYGENIYIQLEAKEEESIIHLCSTTLFGMHSWGKNEKNFDVLISNIDKSLTI